MAAVCASVEVCGGVDTRVFYEVTTDCTVCREPETIVLCPVCTRDVQTIWADPGHQCLMCRSRGTIVPLRLASVRS
jgi:hypothetical protein